MKTGSEYDMVTKAESTESVSIPTFMGMVTFT